MDQVALVRALIERVLGRALVGTYLVGSAVHGGLRPRSDLDFLVVVSRRLTAPEKDALVRGLLPLSRGNAPPGAKRWLEVTVVALPVVRPWRHPARIELQYGDWWRDELEAGEMPWQELNPDLAILIAMALRGNVPLAGPDLADVLDPVPMRDVVQATAETLPGLMAELESDTRNVLLTLARAWVTIGDGAFVPKDVAAERLIGTLPMDHAKVFERARETYLTGGDDRWDDLAGVVRPAAERVAAEISGGIGTSPAGSRREDASEP